MDQISLVIKICSEEEIKINKSEPTSKEETVTENWKIVQVALVGIHLFVF